jgi:hypothetical protein
MWTKGLRDSTKNSEFSINCRRAAELMVKDTNEYWKIQTNFYYHLIRVTRLAYDLKNFSNKTFDFMLRTKSFCYANEFFYPEHNLGYIIREKDNITEFFSSPVLPSSLRFNFRGKKEISEIFEFLDKIQTTFNLSTCEYSALTGTFMGKCFAENPLTAKNIAESDIIKMVLESPKVDSFIFDLAFGSAIMSKEEKHTLSNSYPQFCDSEQQLVENI